MYQETYDSPLCLLPASMWFLVQDARFDYFALDSERYSTLEWAYNTQALYEADPRFEQVIRETSCVDTMSPVLRR